MSAFVSLTLSGSIDVDGLADAVAGLRGGAKVGHPDVGLLGAVRDASRGSREVVRARAAAAILRGTPYRVVLRVEDRRNG